MDVMSFLVMNLLASLETCVCSFHIHIHVKLAHAHIRRVHDGSISTQSV